MGRMDIDYAVFEDAFLRYQTKPKLTEHGDLYYEGKVRQSLSSEWYRHRRPCRLSRTVACAPVYACL